MATPSQIGYLRINLDLIKEPVLIVGSKQYDFDKMSIRKFLDGKGISIVTGIDISEGEGVDEVADITIKDSEFFKKNQERFNTVLCMEIMTHVKNPFAAADNIMKLLAINGTALFSECFVRKISKMPADYWRFTYDGTKMLFSGLEFDDSKAMISLTREKKEMLLPLKHPLPQILPEKHTDESVTGYFLRRLHRKFLSKGIFGMSRLFPEITIYSAGYKKLKA
ncbi:MAG: hypothetical protein HGGPFJEG_01316 [Ignavibacteria bacterium]|nr:hypothetical protein [Ignavibacteria bacterium]